VDAAFGGFDLRDVFAYRAFLTAHARALPGAEERMRRLSFAGMLPPRTPLLAADLAALGGVMPRRLPLPAGDDAAAWGTLYVVEGSRLGGAMLARAVPAALPAAYLGAVHPPGQWRAIRAAIDRAGVGQDADFEDRMVAGALQTFALYAAASRSG
jgi:heme oxygenase